MPLVAAPVYSAWYKKSSWVYRAFNYLFINPLWEKSVPKGGSLCIFWWSALFSIFVFRPLVYLTLALRGIVRALRLEKLIEWTDKIGPFGCAGAPFGLHTAVNVYLFMWIGLFLYTLGSVLIDLYSFGYLTVCTLPILSCLVCLFCYLHANENRHNEDHCKVEVYARITLGMSVILVALNHPSLFVSHFLMTPLKIGSFVWKCIVGVAIWTWNCVGRLCHTAPTEFPYAWIGIFIVIILLVVGRIMECVMSNQEGGSRFPREILRKEINWNLYFIAHHIYKHYNQDIYYSISEIRSIVNSCPQCRAFAEKTYPVKMEEIAPLIEIVINAANQRALAKQTRIENRSQACKRMTQALTTLCSPFVALGGQIRIAASYAWALVKAFKGKNCPYLRFED